MKKSKIKKTVLKLIVLLVLGYFLLTYLAPDFLQKNSSFLQNYINLPTSSKQVLGVNTVDWLEPKIKLGIEYLNSLPIVQEFKDKATDKVNQEIEKVINKPREDVDKVKRDVRETVCEDWFAE